MGFFDLFRSSSKAADAAVDTVSAAVRGIDALFFTDEEKEGARQKWFGLWLKGQEALQGENTARSITRRILAILIVGHELLFLDMAAVLYLMGKGDQGKLMLGLAATLATATTAVVIFYFGYYGVQNIIGAWKKKDED